MEDKKIGPLGHLHLSGARLSAGGVEFGVVQDFRPGEAAVLTPREPLKEQSVTISFNMSVVPRPGLRRLQRELHDQNIAYRKLLHRALRPYRKARRRSLTRKRIRATRAGAPLAYTVKIPFVLASSGRRR